MRNTLKSYVMKSKFMLVGAVFALTVTAAGIASIAQPQSALAASCDKVNIVYCGIDGSDGASTISAFKSVYASNTSNGHADLQTVYNWAGLSGADVSGMNTSNTKLGTLYRNGQIQVNGTTVATDSWVTARFTEGTGFVAVSDGVWARKTTTSFANDSVPVLVHYLSDGTVDSAVMTGCGNAVKVTPVPPAPKPVLVCNLLTATTPDSKRAVTYTATASASNTKIVSYVFNYGDGKTATVASNATSVTSAHTYAADNTTYKATVAVNGTDQTNVTSATCATTVKTQPTVVKPALVCSSLVFSEDTTNPLTFKFVARAVATKTTITSYVYHFGDGTTMEVKTADGQSNATHTYTENNKTFVAYVEVNSTDLKNVTSATCKVDVSTPKPEECKPGVPKGDSRCTEVVTTTPPAAPTTLVNTGAGSVATLFAGTSLLGAIGHRFFLKRRMAS